MRQGLSLGAVLVRRPRLVPSAVRLGLGLVPRRWWRRPPFLPLPDRRWIAFRMEVAYGDATAVPSREDLADYLAWTRQMRTWQGTWRRQRQVAR
ncbi:MAG: hypothetical protein ACLQAN_04690 [Acidimicrobiales bacterium]